MDNPRRSVRTGTGRDRTLGAHPRIASEVGAADWNLDRAINSSDFDFLIDFFNLTPTSPATR
jgi:hypothetical protein